MFVLSPKFKIALFMLCIITRARSIDDNEMKHEKENLLRDDDVLWTEFQAEYRKVYATEEERTYRKSVFIKNLKSIRELNAKYPQTLLGLNSQADTTLSETNRRSISLNDIHVQTNDDHPSHCRHELRKSKLTSVKDQQDCGASDVFASVAVIESMFAKKYETKTFSEQAIINCCKQGCGGCKNDKLDGPLVYALRFGLPTSSDFKNTNKKGTCKRYSVSARPTGIKYLRSVSEGMKHLNKKGPFVAGLYSSCDYFKFYQRGILFPTSDCIGTVNHSVAVVGFGTEVANETKKQETFWIIKNSWGKNWGENGYGKVLLGYNSFNIETKPFIGLEGIKRNYFAFELITFILMALIGIISISASFIIIFISQNHYSDL